jgi:simple sugar transport system permease protein
MRFVLAAFGLILFLIIVLASFGLPVVPSLELLFKGALGDKFGVSRTLVKAVPLLLTSLGIVVAWRAKIYNIGGEGQFLLGGLAGAALFKALGPMNPSVMLLAAACGGAAWAAIAGWLQVKRGVEAVISTILLNFVAINLLGWLVSGPLQESKRQLPQTQRLPPESMLPRFDRQTDLHAGIYIALSTCILIHVFLFLTPAGYRLRLTGENARLALVNKVDGNAVKIGAMALSGALCGLAGGVEYLGIAGQVGREFSQNWGFLGIPVALLAGLHPLMLPGAALFFGGLFAGSENLARFTPAGTTIVYVIQAAAVLGYVAISARRQRRGGALK